MTTVRDFCFLLIFSFVRRRNGGVEVVGTEDGKLLSTIHRSRSTAFLVPANTDRAVSSGKSSPSHWAQLWGLHEGGCLFVEMRMEAPIEWVPGIMNTRWGHGV